MTDPTSDADLCRRLRECDAELAHEAAARIEALSAAQDQPMTGRAPVGSAPIPSDAEIEAALAAYDAARDVRPGPGGTTITYELPRRDRMRAALIAARKAR